jgi:spore coat polysaccharide biosynthesis predicted glycosyltransferase SpsG
MLNDDFRRERELLSRQSAPIRRVVVLLGPADLHNVTGMAVEALLGSRAPVDEVDVVLGGKHPFAEEISRLAGMSGRFRVHQTLPSMAPLFSTAQLAIGASGTTTLERACLKLPALVTVIAENQRPVARAIASAAPALWLGDAAELSVEAIRDRFELVADGTHPDLDSRRLPEIDGHGADRIVAHMIDATQ